MNNNDAKTKQMLEFAAAGMQLGKKADLKIKSAEIVNRKIDDVQQGIHHLLRVTSLDGMSTADLMLTIQSADLNDQQLRQLHYLMQLHHQLMQSLSTIETEIRNLADQTKTISFMIQVMNEI